MIHRSHSFVLIALVALGALTLPPSSVQAEDIDDGSPLVTAFVVPEARKPDHVDPKGWYAAFSVDVLGRTSDRPATLRIEVRVKGAKTRLARGTYAVQQTATRHGGRTTAASQAVREWLKIPSDQMVGLAGKTLEVELSVKGESRVVVENLRLDMFHDEPSRPLVGKPNGKNGPDLLASGMLGFLGLTEHLTTAFSLLEIREGGPAERAGLRRSDLVVRVDDMPLRPSSLAAGRAWFEGSHEAALGRAIERALEQGRKSVQLGVLRDGGVATLELKLPIKTGFGPSFPTGDKLAARLENDVLDWVATHQKPNGLWPGNAAVNSCLAGLALLGTRDRKHKAALRRLVDKLLETNPEARDTRGFSYWSIAYQGVFFCEYHLASGDKRALAWIEDAIEWLPSTTHPSKWGMPAFGHSPKGLPYGEKALMAPCAHLLLFDALAEQCGVTSGVWKHIEPYVMHSWSDPEKGGHGAMGYNAAAKDKAQFWSRSGLVALALHLRGHHEPMQQALTKIMVERHPWMLNSHAYGEPGAALGLVALAVVDPEGFAQVMPQWRWRFLNAWEPGFGLRYSSPHMGAPYMGEEEIVNPAYALLFATLSRGLVLAGGEPKRWLGR